MLSIIIISLVTISILALSSIKTSADKTFDLIYFKWSAEQLKVSFNEVCAFGNGGSEEIYIDRTISLYSYEDYFRIIDEESGETLVSSSFCDVRDFSHKKGNLSIENKEGVIIVR